MKIVMLGCSHHHAPVEVREKIAFRPQQIGEALSQLRVRFPETEGVIVSTCNRVEVYAAADDLLRLPSHHDLVEFVAQYHGLNSGDIFDFVTERSGEDAVRHLFTVAASLDSMVVGEAQILGQVKSAYDLATTAGSTGPLTHSAFQAAMRVAKRVATETAINQKRVSIPSVAVADFARGIFERFDDKQVLVIGAGDMAEETLRYLADEGVQKVAVVNRSLERAKSLADEFKGRAEPWDNLEAELVAADLVISTTGATLPIVTLEMFRRVESRRSQRTLFVLDLAVPRDFEPAIGTECPNVYLYGVDDLRTACEANRRAREAEWPLAEKIVDEETNRFLAELNHRATAPTIRRLRSRAEEWREEELARLLNRLGTIDPRMAEEIRRSFERLVNKLLHPPLESLRDDAQRGASGGLLEALKRLFRLDE